jgi:hypothetical protein
MPSNPIAAMTIVTKPKDICRKKVVAMNEPVPLPVNAIMLLYAPTNPRHYCQTPMASVSIHLVLIICYQKRHTKHMEVRRMAPVRTDIQ